MERAAFRLCREDETHEPVPPATALRLGLPKLLIVLLTTAKSLTVEDGKLARGAPPGAR